MQTTQERGKLVVKDGWLICPVCGKMRVLHLTEKTRATDLPVYCRRCRTETIVNIEPEPEPERLSQ